jgi:hypothetical protein
MARPDSKVGKIVSDLPASTEHQDGAVIAVGRLRVVSPSRHYGLIVLTKGPDYGLAFE